MNTEVIEAFKLVNQFIVRLLAMLEISEVRSMFPTDRTLHEVHLRIKSLSDRTDYLD